MKNPQRPAVCPLIHAVSWLAAVMLPSSADVRTRAAAEEVVGVVACDGYGDLRKQVRWVGGQVGNPALEGFVESFVAMATQFRGLDGLDTTRPAAVILTAGETGPSGHGFVPVTDIDRLLGSLSGLIGPVRNNGGLRQIAPPGGIPLDIAQRGGWAVLSPRGQTCPVDDPLPLVRPLLETNSLGVEVFPARMPAPMRDLLRRALGQAGVMAAAQGQPLDPAAVDAVLSALDELETIRLGIDIDETAGAIALENTQVVVPGSPLAAMLGGDVGTPLTVATGAPGGDADLALAGHWCVKTAASFLSPRIVAAALPSGDDPRSEAVFGVVRDLVQSMADTGGVEAAFAVDTASATADDPVPAAILGVRIGDGRALEQDVKGRLGAADALPEGVTARFDSGKAGPATLHTIAVAGLPGLPAGPLEATLAVTPDYVFLLTGGDVAGRVGEALKASGRPRPQAEPLGQVTFALAPVLGYLQRVSAALAADAGTVERLAAAEAVAAGERSATVSLVARPLERGARYRLRVDGGAVRAIAALLSASPVNAAAPVGARGRPAAPAVAGP